MAKRPGPGPDELDADLLDDAPPPDAIAAALTDELDLHNFLPRDCADVVAEYLHAAQAAGMTRVRIVHGKGTGTLRRIVHGVLDGHPPSPATGSPTSAPARGARRWSSCTTA